MSNQIVNENFGRHQILAEQIEEEIRRILESDPVVKELSAYEELIYVHACLRITEVLRDS